ncbi:hypothetical protein [Pararhodobacter sp.]|uniref:hypothetical protein n=1 Tax=Pararhodobacter sp. TaxID=2127056 RepID=UPI002FE12640
MEYFATLVLKLMVKHGWPAKLELLQGMTDEGDSLAGFYIHEQGEEGEELPPDMQAAFETACRIVAKTYRVDYQSYHNWADLTREYRVTTGGHFREVKT